MIQLLLVIALIGFLAYLLTELIPMPDSFKKLIIAVAIILIILYLISVFGFDIPLPRRGAR